MVETRFNLLFLRTVSKVDFYVGLNFDVPKYVPEAFLLSSFNFKMGSKSFQNVLQNVPRETIMNNIENTSPTMVSTSHT